LCHCSRLSSIMPGVASSRDGVLNVQWTEFTRQFLRHSEHCNERSKNRPIEPLSHPWDPEDPILKKGKARMKIQLDKIADLKAEIADLKRVKQGGSNQRRNTARTFIAPSPWERDNPVRGPGGGSTPGYGDKPFNKLAVPLVPPVVLRRGTSSVVPPYDLDPRADKKNLSEKESCTTLQFRRAKPSIDREIRDVTEKHEVAVRELLALKEQIRFEYQKVSGEGFKSGRQKLGGKYRSQEAPWNVKMQPRHKGRKMLAKSQMPGYADTFRTTRFSEDGADTFENVKPRTPRYDWVNF